MDYVSKSTFKMGNHFIRIEPKKVDYIENELDWIFTQALLVSVKRNLSEIAFQCLSRFPILTSDIPVTLKTKQPMISRICMKTSKTTHELFNDRIGDFIRH